MSDLVPKSLAAKMAEHKAQVDAALGQQLQQAGSSSGHDTRKRKKHGNNKNATADGDKLNQDRLAAYEPTSKRRKHK